MSAAMSPTYHQRPMPGTQEPGNHSFTSKDSGTGDSVPTEHNQFLSKFKSFKQKITFEKVRGLNQFGRVQILSLTEKST